MTQAPDAAHLAAASRKNPLLRRPTMLGIDDPLIWLAYIGCVAGDPAQRRLRRVRRNRAPRRPHPGRPAWAKEEKKVEDED
jgi:hypothetical protein